MSERVVKRLKCAASGTKITRRGMRELKRLYYGTPRKVRSKFLVHDAIRSLQRQEYHQRAEVAEKVKIFRDHVLPQVRRKRRRDFLMAVPMAIATFCGWRR